jgi:putative Ca2+/H+ antiporter (TMEM165/GDT1 family)
MDAVLTSLGLVAIAEMGDKTQLLALFLATRFRRPWPIIGGILTATVGNHLLASWVGVTVADRIPLEWLRWGLGASFLAMAAWTLIPDKLDDGKDAPRKDRGAYLTTLVTFFFVEMGDKTQIATVALAAEFKSIWLVATGTTLGMMLADVPAVFLGERLTRAIPAATMRYCAAGLFAIFGVAVLIGW